MQNEIAVDISLQVTSEVKWFQSEFSKIAFIDIIYKLSFIDIADIILQHKKLMY